MDDRSFSSRYDFSESETGSIHSGQGRTARTVSLARRYVSTVSLFSSRKKQSLRQRGSGVRTAASELCLRNKGGEDSVEERPKSSYLFSLGNERDGLVEIIPQTLGSDGQDDGSRDELIQVIFSSPTGYPNDVENAAPIGGAAFSQWRHSALLPVPGKDPVERPGTGGSSIYSEDARRLDTIEDCASSTHSRDSQESGGPRTLVPAKRLLRTRSLLSLAKRYSSQDDEVFTYSPEERETSDQNSAKQDASFQDDNWSFYSQDDRGMLQHPHPSTEAGAVNSPVSPMTSTRDSWNLTSLPPLSTEQIQQPWPLPSPIDEQPKDAAPRIWWRRNSNFSQTSGEKTEANSREVPLHCHNQEATLRRRPSSWSWLTINTIMSDRTSSTSDWKSSDASISGGNRYIRASVRASIASDSSSATNFSRKPNLSPSEDSGVYRGQHRLSTGNNSVVPASEVPQFFHIHGWKAPKRDPLELPPLQLPELPDEQRVSFYTRCGHFEIDPELVAAGRELEGWCPECTKIRRSKRRNVKKELKSILRSIAE